MTKLTPKTVLTESVHVQKDNKAAREKLLTLSILLDISITDYTSEITYTEVKKKEVEL